MGRFDHLIVHDSDSDSSDPPSNTHTTGSPPRREEDPQVLSETLPAPPHTLADIPDGWRVAQPKPAAVVAPAQTGVAHSSPQGTPMSQRQSPAEEEAPAAPGPVMGGTPHPTPDVPVAVALPQDATPTADSDASAAAAPLRPAPSQLAASALGSARSTAGSLPSRGLPARRQAPASSRALQTPMDPPQSVPQPLSIAKEDTPTHGVTAPTEEAPAPEPTTHHRAILSRTPTTSASSGTTASRRSQMEDAIATPASAAEPVKASRSTSLGHEHLAPASQGPPHTPPGSSGERNSVRSSRKPGSVESSSGKAQRVSDGSEAASVQSPAARETPASRPAAKASASASQQHLCTSSFHTAASGSHSASHVGVAALGPTDSPAEARVAAAADRTSAQGSVGRAAEGTAAAPAKQKKAKGGCGLFSFCRRKKEATEEPQATSEPRDCDAQPQLVAASASQPEEPHSQQVASCPAECRRTDASASEGERSEPLVGATPGQASLHSATPVSHQSPVSTPAHTPDPAASQKADGGDSLPDKEPGDPEAAEEAAEQAATDLPEALGVAPASSTPAEEARATTGPAKGKRVRVRKHRTAAAVASEPSSDGAGASGKTSGSSAVSQISHSGKPSSTSASSRRPPDIHNGGGTPNAAVAAAEGTGAMKDATSVPPTRVLLAERARTPTPDDVAFPVPASTAHQRPSTAVVRSVHSASVNKRSITSSRSGEASHHSSSGPRTPDSRTHAEPAGGLHSSEGSAAHSYSSSYAERESSVEGSRHSGKADIRGEATEFPDATEGAGLTTEAVGTVTKGDDEASSAEEASEYSLLDDPQHGRVGPPRPQQQRRPLVDSDVDELSRLPAYQRRLVLDMRAKQRRELEELAKDWQELTFHPSINASPQYTIKNAMHFSDRLSISRPTTPMAHSYQSGEASFGVSPLRRPGHRDTYTGEPTPSFSPEISSYAQSRPQRPGTVFDRLTAKPKDPPAPVLPTEAQGCSFAPAISEKSRQMAPTTNVFTRLSRLPPRAATGTGGASDTSPRRRGQHASRSPSPRRASRSDGAAGGETVFERLYRKRKTPTTSPATSPRRGQAERYAHQPQITAAARRMSDSRTQEESDFGERLYAKRKDSQPEEAGRGAGGRTGRTPFYPSSAGSPAESAGSAAPREAAGGQHPNDTSCADDANENGFRSGYLGSASGSDSAQSRADKPAAVPLSA